MPIINKDSSLLSSGIYYDPKKFMIQGLGYIFFGENVAVTDYLLALTTLGDATQIGSFLFYALLPKVAKPSTLSLSLVFSL
jgi:hypothetical protein